jgi:hypothetical protein
MLENVRRKYGRRQRNFSLKMNSVSGVIGDVLPIDSTLGIGNLILRNIER